MEDLVNHIVGGVLMGFGGVTALGCTIGQGLTGISTLALGSLLAVGGDHRRLCRGVEVPVLESRLSGAAGNGTTGSIWQT